MRYAGKALTKRITGARTSGSNVSCIHRSFTTGFPGSCWANSRISSCKNAPWSKHPTSDRTLMDRSLLVNRLAEIQILIGKHLNLHDCNTTEFKIRLTNQVLLNHTTEVLVVNFSFFYCPPRISEFWLSKNNQYMYHGCVQKGLPLNLIIVWPVSV